MRLRRRVLLSLLLTLTAAAGTLRAARQREDLGAV